MHNSKEFFESIPLGVCVVKRDRKDLEVLFANHALIYMLRAGKKTAFVTPYDVIGLTLSEIWPSRQIKKLSQRLLGTTPPQDFTLPIHDNDVPEEHQRWAKITISETRYNENDAYILWVTDISASKEAEARLKKEVAAADAIAETKANFLATMSHEIRTPMQSIYGFLELISEEKPAPTIQSMVDTAKNSASGLLEILDDILDFAKIDAQQMELDTFEVPVRTLVRGTLEALSVKVRGKKVALIDDIAQDVPFVIVGDPKRLRQIIMNLAGNALKFTEDGSVTLRVTRYPQVLPSPNHGLALRFEVIDTGIGMSQEVKSRLFQPFQQADNSTSRKYGGTGLGLSICRRLVHLMGGEIGVDSIPGEGSTFWFEIPTLEVSTENHATPDLPSLIGMSVLSVEDHPQGAKEIVKSLQSMGATVESCPTYKEALELVKRRPFDVGVIDQGLPDGLGLELIKEIMNIRPFMGLIMYTVRDDIGLQHSLQALGVPYLSKPASRVGLGTSIKDAGRKVSNLETEGPARLLIAEDNETVRQVLHRQLERLGVVADFVSNGNEALETLASGKYSILFTDLHMPDIDGYGVIKAIRDKEKNSQVPGHFPVVVLTADVQMVQRQIYLAHGFDECLLKPVSLGQLRRLLIRWGLLNDNGESTEGAALPPGVLPEGGAQTVNIEALMEQIGADRAEAIEMLQMFIDMSAGTIEEIQALNSEKNFEALKECAHSLKGAARSACCMPLGDLAAQLQNDSENQKPSDRIVHQIAAEYGRVKDAVLMLK